MGGVPESVQKSGYHLQLRVSIKVEYTSVTNRNGKEKWIRKNNVAAPMSEIECSNPPENLTDRKMRCFYIEAMSKNISEAQQKIFFRDALKKN